mgnify:CR=1 FL=1
MVIFLFITRTVWDRYLQVVIVKLDAINAASSFYSRTHIHVTGVAQRQARVAHNHEVIRSKRIAGIVKLDAINAAQRRWSYCFTDMAQRQRAGLITPRSLDRNGLSVS